MNTPFDIAETVTLELSEMQRKAQPIPDFMGTIMARQVEDMEARARAANAERDANDELWRSAEQRAREGMSDE